MRKFVTLIIAAVVMTTIVAGPTFGETVITPGNGGEGWDTNPGEPISSWEKAKSGYENPIVKTESVNVIINGTKINPDVPAFIDGNSRVQVPIRAIGETLGFKISFIEPRVINVDCNEYATITYYIDGKTIYIHSNGRVRQMYPQFPPEINVDTSPIYRNGRAFIPLRLLEITGCSVTWEENSNTVLVTSPTDTSLKGFKRVVLEFAEKRGVDVSYFRKTYPIIEE